MSDSVENNEHQDKKARIDKEEEPVGFYATPQTLCIVANSAKGYRCYFWNQSGELNDTEKKLIGNFLKPEAGKDGNDPSTFGVRDQRSAYWATCQ